MVVVEIFKCGGIDFYRKKMREKQNNNFEKYILW